MELRAGVCHECKDENPSDVVGSPSSGGPALDGDRRRYGLFVQPVRDRSGDISGISGVALDITTFVE